MTPGISAAADAEEMPPAAALERRIAELSAVDPLQPLALEARLEYARLLTGETEDECLTRLATAEQQVAPLLAAAPETLLALPDGLPDATSLLQSIQVQRGQCETDEAAARRAFEASIASGSRAIELLRDNWDFEEMATAQFNVAYARYELGDLAGALRDLEQVLDWDEEFGLRDELRDDYATLLRWSSGGAEPDPAEVERYAGGHNALKARFGFVWRPHVSHWSVRSEQEDFRGGRYDQVAARYDSRVEVRHEQDDWVLVTTLENVPRIEMNGATLTAADSERLAAVVGGLGAALPEIVVAADGSFKTLRNLERLRATLSEKLRPMLQQATPPDRAAASSETLDRVLDVVSNQDLLTAIAAGDWGIKVAAWIGGEFDHGDWYATTLEEPIPGLSNEPVVKTFTFKVSRWLPCAPGREPSCAELLVRIVPEPESLIRAVGEFVRRLMPAASPEEIEKSMRAVSSVYEARYRLITEPDTLRPWSVEQRQYLYSASGEGGRRTVAARSARRLETARYAD